MLNTRLFLTIAFSTLAFAQRPPAVPLVTQDPYFSIWAMKDKLNEDVTRHWTGKPNSLTSFARVDGKSYWLMGFERDSKIESMTQKDLSITPTQTRYRFETDAVAISLTFTSPLLPDDLEMLSRPLSYITWSVQSRDGHEHAVQLYFDAASDIAVDTPSQQPVVWSRLATSGLHVLRVGSRTQRMLEKSGDDLRIDWGYLYAAARADAALTEAANDRTVTREAFTTTGAIPAEDAFADHDPRRGKVKHPVLAFAFDLGQVGAAPKSRFIMLAYDDVYSMEFLDRRVRAYWHRNGADAAALLHAAAHDYESVIERCDRFDRKLSDDLTRAGGKEYAALCALAYRQAVAAHKLAVDNDGTLLFFPKENKSNGSVDTVDVFYPSAPLFLLVNPKLLRASVEPIMQYAMLPGRWPWPYAPHDLGTYPLANGQTYGGGEETEEHQMPVEESGNMILLVAALAKAEGHPDLAQKYWPLVTKWAEYLRDKGLDPADQLCTDDFAGHLARNANLSVKAIEALGAFAMLARQTGHAAESDAYRTLAQAYAQKWQQLAADGDHYVLAFGQAGTWSQKYNLVWDRLLGLNLFPREVARKEIAFYLTKQNQYGLPLDNREEYTKLDWLVWTATLAERPADFQALVAPAYKWMNETPTRVPLTDWYMTKDGKQRDFQARSVVGGLFIKLLAETWK